MEKKYFFFDIDNTLTDVSRHITPSSKEAILKLQEKGHFVAVATGRALYRTRDLTDGVGIHNIVCCGGACLVLDGNIVEDTPLDIDKCRRILRHADELGLGWLLTLDDTDSCYVRDYKFLEQGGRRNEVSTYKLIPNLDYEKIDKIVKVYLAMPKGDEQKYPWLDELPYLRFGPNFIVFEQDEKKDGILKMMEMIDGPIEDIVVFGDSKNDLSMFDKRWTSIAMGNGSEDLKAMADYVTTSNLDDGVYNACKHFGWI